MEVVGGTNVYDVKELEKTPQIIIGTPGRVLDMILKKSLPIRLKLFLMKQMKHYHMVLKILFIKLYKLSLKQHKYVYLVRQFQTKF